MPDAKRIAVVGGGPAGLTAAWEILSRDPTAHVTLYQMGWRLGGKLATSRNLSASDRIQEHGIHILFGAYENTFHVLRGAHAELGTDWKQEFTEHGHATLMERIQGEWRPWSIGFPRRSGDPGDALALDLPGGATLTGLAQTLLLWLMDHVLDRISDPFTRFAVKKLFEAAIDQLPGVGANLTAENVDSIVSLLAWILRILKTVRAIATPLLFLAGLLGFDVVPWENRLRRLWIVADLGSATVAGLLRAAVNGETTKDIDAKELRVWLSDNAPLGALSPEARDSAPLSMVYEVVFAYENADVNKPSLAAGTAVHALMRLLFDYRGAFVYKMNCGSETVVNALYDALQSKNDGVPNSRITFEFFHRLEAVELDEGHTRVEKLTFTRQATPIGAYEPRVGNDLEFWPEHPNYDQLVEGAQLKAGDELASEGFDLEALQTGSPISVPVEVSRRTSADETVGFDEVVLAVSVGGLHGSTISDQLSGKSVNSPNQAQMEFHDMLTSSHAVATQAAQLWFSETALAMGWPHADDLVGTFAQPFGNWADLSVTVPCESWPPGQEPGHVAYLAGPLLVSVADSAIYDPKGWRTEVGIRVESWLETEAKALWPDAYDTAGFKWDWLVDPSGGAGSARLQAQWLRANRNEGELYTLTLPGNTKHRLGPGSGFANLHLAGDWTDNGFNVGAVEAAVMSGRLAARALLGQSFTVYGEA